MSHLIYIQNNITKFVIALSSFSIAVLVLIFFSVSAQAAPLAEDPSMVTTRVNKQVGIGNFTPQDLVSLSGLEGGNGLFIREVAYNDLKALMADMSAQGIPVKINSAYRSYDAQTKLYNSEISKNPANANTVAQPGFSEHQLGLALDFGAVSGSTSGFASTKQSAWLASNGYKYGFALSYPAGKQDITGYTYEPWHWRYIGREYAVEWQKSGLVLDQYLATLPQRYEKLSLVGQKVKAQGDPTVYYINANGTKRGFIAASAYLSYGWSWNDVLTISEQQLLEFPETRVVKLQGNPTVYQFNKDKTRQAIASSEAFQKLNYTWTDIVEINATELAGYPEGPIIK